MRNRRRRGGGAYTLPLFDDTPSDHQKWRSEHPVQIFKHTVQVLRL